MKRTSQERLVRIVRDLSKLEIKTKKQEEKFKIKTGYSRRSFYIYRKLIKKSKYVKELKIRGRCYFCSKKATDFHHIDKNRENNSKSNILLLCRPCHTKLHKIYLKL